MRAKPKSADVRRERLVAQVVEILRTGEPSRFRFESDIRHGLRSTWCLRGWGWQAADDTAAETLRDAFSRMRVKRPTWEQAQEVTPPRDDEFHTCPTCHGVFEPFMDRQRFCCAECKRAWSNRKGAEDRLCETKAEWAARAAAAALERRKARLAPCETCGELFDPNPAQRAGGYRRRFCSPKCSTTARRKFVAPAICAHCGAEFMTAKNRRHYCSRQCWSDACAAARETLTT